jgi:MOSC domain-containing protein YiiM
MNPFVESIQVGMPETRGTANAADPFDRPWTTAIFKLPVPGPMEVGRLGVLGDGQADLENHGGDDKAVLFYSAEHFPEWRHVPGMETASFGAFGENFSVVGLTEETVCIGDIWQLGDQVRLQVSQPRQPCWKLARKWRIKDLAHQVQENGRTGWYCRVLVPGVVEAGQSMTLLERRHPEWTIAAANEVMYHRKRDASANLALAALPELSESWSGGLEARAARLLAGHE